MTVDEALDKLSEQRCPIDGSKTAPEFDGEVCVEVCEGSLHHRWPYSSYIIEHDVNYFEGTFDPTTIGELLDDYNAE